MVILSSHFPAVLLSSAYFSSRCVFIGFEPAICFLPFFAAFPSFSWRGNLRGCLPTSSPDAPVARAPGLLLPSAPHDPLAQIGPPLLWLAETLPAEPSRENRNPPQLLPRTTAMATSHPSDHRHMRSGSLNIPPQGGRPAAMMSAMPGARFDGPRSPPSKFAPGPWSLLLSRHTTTVTTDPCHGTTSALSLVC
jgi:hypothetical protein